MADRKSIRKPPRNPPPGYPLNDQRLKAETGASIYRLHTWGNIVPRKRRNGVWFYPEIAIEVVWCIQASPDKNPDKLDKLRLTLWSEGFDHIDIFRFIDRRLVRLSKELVEATPAEIAEVKAEAIRSGNRPDEEAKPQQAQRGKPLGAIFSRIRSETARQSIFESTIDIFRGIAPAASPYDRSAPLTIAIGGVPDLELDFGSMSHHRLRWLINDASAVECEQVRQDYARLTNIIVSVTRPVRIVEPYVFHRLLIRSWDWLNIRIVVVPFLIHLRRLGRAEEFLRNFEAVVATIDLRRDTPQDGELPPHFHRMPAGPDCHPQVLIDIVNGPVDYSSFGDPPITSFDAYLAFEVLPPELPAVCFYEAELHGY